MAQVFTVIFNGREFPYTRVSSLLIGSSLNRVQIDLRSSETRDNFTSVIGEAVLGGQDLDPFRGWKTVLVGHLPDEMTPCGLRNLGSIYGEVTSSRRVNGRNYGFLEFSTEAGAASAVDGLNGFRYRDKILHAQYSLDLGQGLLSANCKVFLRNIPISWDPLHLTRIMTQYGLVSYTKVIESAGQRHAFVTFFLEAAASAARVNLTDESGKNIAVELRNTGRRPEETSLFLGNLPAWVTANALSAMLEPYGVVSVAVTQRGTGSRGGFGFANFIRPSDASLAIAAYNGKDLGTVQKPWKILVAPKSRA